MDQDVINLAKAIRQKESGGNFDAVGDNGTSKGAYQWQSGTWKDHAKQILGDSNAQMTRDNQQAVAYGVMKTWKDSGLNPAQIAAKWNSGSEKGWENKIGTTTINGKPIAYNVPQYVKDVTDTYQKFKLETQPTVDKQTAPYNAPGNIYNPGVTDVLPQEKPGFLSTLGSAIKENVIDPFTSRFSNIDYANQNTFVDTLTTAGAVAGGVVDAVGKTAMGAYDAVGNLPIVGDIIAPKTNENVTQAISTAGDAVSNAIPDSTKDAISNWIKENPQSAASLGAIVDIASLVGTGRAIGLGIKAAGVGLTKEVAETTSKRILQPTKLIDKAGELGNKYIPLIPDAELAKVKTYSDLEKSLQLQNTKDLNNVTSELLKDTTKYRLNDFEINKGGIKTNPVKDAITSLQELGKKTANTGLLQEVNQYVIKLNKGEMLQNDVNELSKLLSRNRSGFSQSGAILKGTNAVKAENTRLALKEIARTGMSPDVAKLDMQVSERIAVATLAKNMATKVAKEVQKARSSSILSKLVGVGVNVSDALSGRILSTALRALSKTQNISAVELEKELVKNLKKLQAINKSKDANQMKQFLQGVGYFGAGQTMNVASDQSPQK